MKRSAIKDVMYGGVMEIMRNSNYYYHSSVNPMYSHFKDEGSQALQEFFNVMAGKMMEAEEEDLDQRAKNLVLKELKNKN